MKRRFLQCATRPVWAGGLGLAILLGCGRQDNPPGRFVAPPDVRPVTLLQGEVQIEDSPLPLTENPYTNTKRPSEPKVAAIEPTRSPLPEERPPSPPQAPGRLPEAERSSQVSVQLGKIAPGDGPVLLIAPKKPEAESSQSTESSPIRTPLPGSPSAQTTEARPAGPVLERTPPVRRLKTEDSRQEDSTAGPVQRPSAESRPIQRPKMPSVAGEGDRERVSPPPAMVDNSTSPTADPPPAPKTSPAASYVDLKVSPRGPGSAIPLLQIPLAASAADARTMEAVRMRARGLVNNGTSLAHRGAYYSARAEFIQALRLITQTLDTQNASRDHSAALSSGLVALDEAKAFIPEGAKLEADLDLALIIRSHRTPALKDEDLDDVTPLSAVQAYFAFAQEQLRRASGDVPEASQALFGLAKLQEYLHGGESENRSLIGPRSIALYQTALTIDPSHAEAANELGVLLARYGQYEDAKQALQQGLRSRQYAESWNNLARVHDLLGETELARLARQEAAGQLSSRGGQVVRWTSPQEFTEEGRPSLHHPEQRSNVVPSRPVESTAQGNQPRASTRR